MYKIYKEKSPNFSHNRCEITVSSLNKSETETSTGLYTFLYKNEWEPNSFVRAIF